jgi:hypothetical protein
MRQFNQMPILRLPKVAGQAHGKPASLPQIPSFASKAPVADPAGLVARALAILAEEDEAWHARRSVDRQLERGR